MLSRLCLLKKLVWRSFRKLPDNFLKGRKPIRKRLKADCLGFGRTIE